MGCAFSKQSRTDCRITNGFFCRQFLYILECVKKKIDCFEVNKALREQYPEIVWVSTSLDGSILQIKIKENEMRRNDLPSLEDAKGIDLIATCDGVITQIITRKGIPTCTCRRSSEKGDILVSGKLEIKNDSQEIIRYQYEHSDADVFADTIQNIYG